MNTKEVSKTNEGKGSEEMSFLDHLEQLRWHIVRAVAAILVGAIVMFALKDIVFEHIIFAPKQDSFITYRLFCMISEATCFYPPKFNLVAIQMGEQFFIHIKVSLFLGFIVAFPYIFWEVWKFIKPGLYDQEKKAASGIVFICSFLFILGVLFGYYVITPFAINFLAGYSVGVDTISSPSLESYVSYLTMFTMPTGLVFELPIVVLFLSKVGLVTPQLMRKFRKHAVIFILIMSAMITPPDAMSQFLIGIPIFILYEVGIQISKRVLKAKKMKNK